MVVAGEGGEGGLGAGDEIAEGDLDGVVDRGLVAVERLVGLVVESANLVLEVLLDEGEVVEELLPEEGTTGLGGSAVKNATPNGGNGN